MKQQESMEEREKQKGSFCTDHRMLMVFVDSFTYRGDPLLSQPLPSTADPSCLSRLDRHSLYSRLVAATPRR